MKAVVFKLSRKYAVALTPSGDFVRVKNSGYAVGQEIMIPAKAAAGQRERRPALTFMRLAAAFVLIIAAAIGSFFGASGWYGNNKSVWYTAALEINPYVQIAVNKRDRVLEVYAANDDALSLNPGQWKGGSAENFIDKYLSACADGGFITPGKIAEVKLTVNGVNVKTDAKAKAEAMESAVNKKFDALNIACKTETFVTENGKPVIMPEQPPVEQPPEPEIKYTVIYIANDKVFLVESYSADKPVAAPQEKPKAEIESYEFKFWAKERQENISETTGLEDFFKDGSRYIPEDMPLYAVFG